MHTRGPSTTPASPAECSATSATRIASSTSTKIQSQRRRCARSSVRRRRITESDANNPRRSLSRRCVRYPQQPRPRSIAMVKAHTFPDRAGRHLALTVAAALSLAAPAAADAAPHKRLGTKTAVRTASVPIIRQTLRNNCETAALAMLIASRGVHVSQLKLQRELPRSGPLDPTRRKGSRLPIWGDPNLGFVGRAAGGGTSGGFGVYPHPIRQLARRHGVALTPLTQRPLSQILAHLRAGRPVMVWIGLSDGPYMTWKTPRGRTVKANFGEHTVVLTGMRGSLVKVNDPLDGRRKLWTQSYLASAWQRLGRRALGT